jgi:hypothetical protein
MLRDAHNVMYESISTCDDSISEEDLQIFPKSGAVVIPARRTSLTGGHKEMSSTLADQ